MSLSVLSEVWSRSRAGGTHLLVMLALADNADASGVAWPSEKDLAERSRCDVRTVRRCIAASVESGELDLWEWIDKSGRRHNAYRVVVGELAAYKDVRPGDELRERARDVRRKIPKSVRQAVMERDGSACVYCSSVMSIGIDHRIPVSRGGTDEIDNLCVACGPCNSSKGSQTVEEWISSRLERGDKLSGHDGTRMSGNDGTPVSAPARARLSDLEPSDEPSYKPRARGNVVALRGDHPEQASWKVDRKAVTEAEGGLARAVLETWNDLTGQTLTARDWLSKIVMRVREHPELALDEHEHLIVAALRDPWWTGPPSPSVIYGNGAQFERCVEQARGYAGPARPARYGRGLSARQVGEMFAEGGSA